MFLASIYTSIHNRNRKMEACWLCQLNPITILHLILPFPQSSLISKPRFCNEIFKKTYLFDLFQVLYSFISLVIIINCMFLLDLEWK